MKPSRKHPSAPRRRHRFINKPSVTGAILNMTPVVRATVAGRTGPPPSIHIPLLQSSVSERDRQRTLTKTSDTFTLYGFAFAFLLPLTLQILVQNWEFVPVTVSMIILNLLATRYTKHPYITHRFSKIIRKIYFVTYGNPENELPSKQVVRIPVLFAQLILLLAIGMPLAIGHQRPPLIDIHRYLDRTGYMDYLHHP
jgi:hypothetical protein